MWVLRAGAGVPRPPEGRPGARRQLGLLRGKTSWQWRGGAGFWGGLDVPAQGHVCVRVCVSFIGPELPITYPHMWMSVREHLCEHLYHGERRQLPGYKQKARQHLESCARGWH